MIGELALRLTMLIRPVRDGLALLGVSARPDQALHGVRKKSAPVGRFSPGPRACSVHQAARRRRAKVPIAASPASISA